jgi:hypothetical protein
MAAHGAPIGQRHRPRQSICPFRLNDAGNQPVNHK